MQAFSYVYGLHSKLLTWLLPWEKLSGVLSDHLLWEEALTLGWCHLPVSGTMYILCPVVDMLVKLAVKYHRVSDVFWAWNAEMTLCAFAGASWPNHLDFWPKRTTSLQKLFASLPESLVWHLGPRAKNAIFCTRVFSWAFFYVWS